MTTPFRADIDFWDALDAQATLQGPVILTVHKICGACGDWLTPKQPACLIVENYDGGSLEDYTHWNCAQKAMRP